MPRQSWAPLSKITYLDEDEELDDEELLSMQLKIIFFE
jgi:hypothetical protein